MGDVGEKLVYFQAITGLEDSDLCTEILAAHGWDLELAIAAFTGGNNPSFPEPSAPTYIAPDVGNGGGESYLGGSSESRSSFEHQRAVQRSESSSLVSMAPNLAWRLVTLPISVISGGLGLVSGAVGLGLWAAGGVLSYSLGMLGYGSVQSGESSASPLVSASPASSEAMAFIAAFEREFAGRTRPNFVAEGFMEALQRSRHAYKLLFVYLHSPDHPDTSFFCERTLCNEVFSEFVNENFVSWGGSIRSSEGFKMSNSLKASRFPFCAVVMAATNQRIALLQQIEGPRTPEEMLPMLQRVLEETGSVLVSARLEAEERRNNIRLREEQDAAYREALEADQARELQKQEEQERLEREAAEAERKLKEEEEAREREALEADQARELQKQEEQERLEREAAEAERKLKEEEEAREREAREAAEREAALARRRQEKALSLGDEPEKGPDVTQVLVRFPAGERKGRRFLSSATVQSLYDYVDSLDCLNVEDYSLVTNFPRTVYGSDKRTLTLKEGGLHPQASLFIELSS